MGDNMVKKITNIVTGRYRIIYLLIMDVFFFILANGLALALRYDLSIPDEMLVGFGWHAVITSSVMLALFYLFGLYDSLWQFASVEELINTVTAAIVGTGLLAVIGAMFGMLIPRSWYFLFPLLVMAFNGGIRIFYRILRRALSSTRIEKKSKVRIMIAGGGEAGAMVIRELQKNPQLGKTPVVIVDDDVTKKGKRLYGIPIRGNRNDIASLVQKMSVDEIIIAIPTATKKTVQEVLHICKETSCKLQILPALYQLIDGRISLKKLRDVDVVDLLGRDPVAWDVEHIRAYLTGKNVLVTGGGGSIGSELCRQIAAFRPASLVVLDIYENNVYEIGLELERRYPNLNLHIEIGSVCDERGMANLFGRYQLDVVFHAAAHKHVPLMESNIREALLNNVWGTMKIARLSKAFDVDKFIMISTDKAVNPTNVMGASKRLAEMIIQGFNKNALTEFVAVRFGNVLGSNGSVIPLFRRQIAQGGPVTVTHPEVVRYFMTVQEAVQLVLESGTMAHGGEMFVLDMGEPVKILKLAEDLIELSGYEPYDDIDIVFIGLRPGEKLYEELLLEEEGLERTRNEKIFIGKPFVETELQMQENLDRLQKVLDSDDIVIKDVLHSILKTYEPYHLEKTENA